MTEEITFQVTLSLRDAQDIVNGDFSGQPGLKIKDALLKDGPFKSFREIPIGTTFIFQALHHLKISKSHALRDHDYMGDDRFEPVSLFGHDKVLVIDSDRFSCFYRNDRKSA